jgi:cytochrome c-type biogenesis protein CcmH/NrfG
VRFIALAIMVLLALPAVAFSAEVSVEHAMSAYAAGNINKAVAELEEYVRLHPQDKKGFYYLGYAYYKKGNMDKAREAFGSAYLLAPDYAPALPEKVVIPPVEPEKPAAATRQEKSAEPKPAQPKQAETR